MAKATRQLSPEELRGFMDRVRVGSQYRTYQANQRFSRDMRAGGAIPAFESRNGSGGGGGGAEEVSLTGNKGFDNAIHVGGRVLDILGMLGYGSQRLTSDVLDKVDAVRKPEGPGDIPIPEYLGVAADTVLGGGAVKSFLTGAGDALTGNQEQLRHGYENIERATDVAGKIQSPRYEDVQDNVNPVAKGIGGFALDVFQDPLTYAPAGPGIAAVRGGLKASTAAARAKEGGDLAKTGAFFNPVTAAKGAASEVKQWGQGVKSTIDGLRRAPSNPVLEEALSTIAPRAANTAAATPAKAPATPSRGTDPAEVKLPEPQQIVQQGVAEGARAAEATAEAAAAPVARAVEPEPVPAPASANVQPRQGAPITEERALQLAPEGSKVTFYGLKGQWTIARDAEGRLTGIPAGKGARRPLSEREILTEGAVTRLPGTQSIQEAVEEVTQKVTEKSIRSQQLADLAPDIAAAAEGGTNTNAILANLRGLTYTANRYPTQLQRQIEQLTPLTDRKLVKEWTEQAAELVGEENAKILRKISDPEEFAAKAKELATERVVNTMEGRTPTDLFRKLTSGRNEFDPAKVRETANLLGLKDIPAAEAGWKTFSDFLRRANAKGAYDEIKRSEVIGRGLLGGSGAPGAAIAEQAAKNMDPEGVKVAAAEAADDLITPQIRQEYDDAIAGVFPAGFEQAYRFQKSNKRGESFHIDQPDFGPNTKAVSTNVFNQNHQYTLWKNLFEQAGKKFKGETGEARQQLLYEYLMDGLKYTDLRLRSLGVVPVNTALGAEAKILKNAENLAFLSFGDILDAMPPETVKALLLAGKDINFPITMLSDVARQALKLSETDLDSVAQARTLLTTIQQRLAREFAAGTKKDTTKWLQNPKNAAILKAVAGAFTQPATVQRLAEANVRNLAFATAVNGQKAWRATEPIIKTLRQFALDPNVSAGKQIDAILEARKAAESMVKSTGIKDTPAEGMAESMLDLETAKITSSAQMQQARGALAQDRAVVDASGTPVPDSVKAKRKEAATEAAAAANAPGKPAAKPKGGPKTDTAKKAAEQTREKANTARTAEHKAAAPTVDEILDFAKKDAETVVDDPVWDLDAAHAAFTMDLPAWLRTTFKGIEKMDGWFGKGDVKAFAISAEMNSQNMIHKYTRALNDVSKGYRPDAVKGAIAIFKGMDGNVGLDAALTNAPADIAAAARSLWPTFSQVFDHSEHGLLQRIGMEGAYLNEYLRRQGVPDQYQLAGTQSWENGTAWTQWDWDKLENPLAILDGYHRAIVKAQVVPDVAANFSAQFGNKSTTHGAALSPEEARAAGWVKADGKSGRSFGLFHFLDKDQYYPKEMLTQLSLMDNYFNASRSLDENALFDKFFRYADPVVNSVKASITLWRPGHHVTNMMGEFLMNSLAGVVNPMRYGDAFAIMRAAGKIDGQSMDSLQKYLRASAPEGVQLKNVENGIPVTIRGKQVIIGHEQIYQLLDQSGAIIHHNNAEDLLNETFDVVGRSNAVTMATKGPNPTQAALMKVNRFAAPGWLGNFSAQRDNVFRIAHAADLLRKGKFNSIEDAMSRLTKEINSFHPNMHTLGAAEQKYVRRLIYFYTWQRQAITRVLTSMIDTPGRIMIAPKALYNVSAANGTDPDSWGDPVADTPGIPDYLRGNIGQWMFHRSLNGEDEGEGQANYLWGQSLNAPQLDILQSVLGSVAVDPEKPGWEQAGDTVWQLTSKNVLQNLSPLFKIPMELGTHAQVGTGIPIQEGEEGQYLLNQTGIRGPLLFTGITPADKNDDPAITDMKRENALYNWATGMRRTIYDGPEQYAIWQRQEQERAREAAERAAG